MKDRRKTTSKVGNHARPRPRRIRLTQLCVGNAQVSQHCNAPSFYEQALVIHREIGDRPGEGTGLWNMSLALDQLGERAQAIQYAEQSLVIREQIEDPRAVKVREQLAETTSK